jgi:uncharacterized metal-binding protein/predicted Fe-Mo cluster-binding NifX family protein
VVAQEVLLLTVKDGAILDRSTTRLVVEHEADLVERLVELGVDLLVCGGIGREIEEVLRANQIRVVNNVAGEAGEVVDALRDGGLAAGHGFPPVDRPRPRRVRGRMRASAADCIDCPGRTCVGGGDCVLARAGRKAAALRGDEVRVFDACRDVAAESDPKPCRIAEVVHFCLGAGYRRVGLAFCWELRGEVEVLVPVLRRHLEVRTVSCRIATRAADDGGGGCACDPVAFAHALNRMASDLNVLAGLCLGCDLIVTRRSRAPVTTLFVKDRALANNPVGAIHTRYHLTDLAGGAHAPLPTRSGEVLR